MKMDLKALLLTALSQPKVLCYRKRVHIGAKSFSINFVVTGKYLTIKNIKELNTISLEKRLEKRKKLMSRAIKARKYKNMLNTKEVQEKPIPTVQTILIRTLRTDAGTNTMKVRKMLTDSATNTPTLWTDSILKIDASTNTVEIKSKKETSTSSSSSESDRNNNEVKKGPKKSKAVKSSATFTILPTKCEDVKSSATFTILQTKVDATTITDIFGVASQLTNTKINQLVNKETSTEFFNMINRETSMDKIKYRSTATFTDWFNSFENSTSTDEVLTMHRFIQTCNIECHHMCTETDKSQINAKSVQTMQKFFITNFSQTSITVRTLSIQTQKFGKTRSNQTFINQDNEYVQATPILFSTGIQTENELYREKEAVIYLLNEIGEMILNQNSLLTNNTTMMNQISEIFMLQKCVKMREEDARKKSKESKKRRKIFGLHRVLLHNQKLRFHCVTDKIVPTKYISMKETQTEYESANKYTQTVMTRHGNSLTGSKRFSKFFSM